MVLPRTDSFRAEDAFDKFEFQFVVKKEVPDTVIKDLQDRFGADIGAAVEHYETKAKVPDKDGLSQANQDRDQEEQPQEPLDPAGRQMCCYRDQFWDKRKRRWVYKPPTKSKPSRKSRRYVLVVRRVYSENHLPSHSVVEVRGEYLRGLLMKMFRDSPEFPLTESNLELERDALRYLYWAKPELTMMEEHFLKHASNSDDTSALYEIKAALLFIGAEWGYMMKNLESSLPNSISFQYLWAIYPPDTLVVSSGPMGNKRVFRQRSNKMRQTQQGVFLELNLEHADFDHRRLGYVHTFDSIQSYEGLCEIHNLPLIPIGFYPRMDKLKKEILHRTEKQLRFYTDRRPRVQQHKRPDNSGIGLLGTGKGQQRFNFRGRLIIDQVMLAREEPRSPLLSPVKPFRVMKGVRFIDLDNSTKEETRESVLVQLLAGEQSSAGHAEEALSSHNYGRIESEMDSASSDSEQESKVDSASAVKSLTLVQKLMFPGLVYGYSLGDETWGAFFVDRLTDVHWDDLLSSLVMDEGLKDTLFGLIKTHVEETSGFDDFVKGKGRGLIGLLSGPPGSGKTLTAEAIAETAKMPLYMVSSGSLGSTSSTVGESLARILRLAHHWKAVLLLDEADVFLAERSPKDLERNAIVSVFLRELEYYPGILLLTTNLPDILDEAFESRIHFFHHYNKLDEAGRETVWRNFARGVTGIGIDIDDAGFEMIRKLDLNGRQIKNVMSISVKLAISKKEKALRTERILSTARNLQREKVVRNDAGRA